MLIWSGSLDFLINRNWWGPMRSSGKALLGLMLLWEGGKQVTGDLGCSLRRAGWFLKWGKSGGILVAQVRRVSKWSANPLMVLNAGIMAVSSLLLLLETQKGQLVCGLFVSCCAYLTAQTCSYSLFKFLCILLLGETFVQVLSISTLVKDTRSQPISL